MNGEWRFSWGSPVTYRPKRPTWWPLATKIINETRMATEEAAMLNAEMPSRDISSYYEDIDDTLIHDPDDSSNLKPSLYIINQVGQGFALIFIMTTAITLNICVVANIRKCSLKLRTVHFLLVQHLCIADLFGALFILPVPLLTTLRETWDAPSELCRFSSAVNVALWLQHILMFVMLKVDRVLASFLPIGRYPIVSVPACTMIIGGSWLVSASVAASVSSGVGSKFEPSVLLCVPRLPREFGITICTLYCSAFATMVVGYVIVILMLKRQESQREQNLELSNQEGGVIVVNNSSAGSSGRGLIRSTLASMFVTAAHLLLYVPTLLVLGLPGAIEHPVPVFLCALVVYSEFLVHPLVLLCSSTKLRNEVRKSLLGGIKKKLLSF
ncbi:uncharacterized protein LOC136034072 [Artemia franciscana]|uniref:uncharacterized protein LOC136034072 n=1 Tax=Artemia franciscana TaxID=6661 RepID=UPI0032DB5F64